MPQKNPDGPRAVISPASVTGPKAAPMPPTSTRLPLAATIWLGSKKSLVWARVSEYMGIFRPPSIPINAHSTQTGKVPAKGLTTKAAAIAQIAAKNVTTVMTRRRSKRSEKRPIGHWNNTPPNSMAAMKIEISAIVSPASVANTAPMPTNPPWAMTVPKVPITPSGEIR